MLVAAFTVGPAAAEPSIDQVIKACGQKTLVFSAQGKRVGEKIDGYCQGFLEGAFAVLVHKGAICRPKDDADPVTAEYLITVLNQYRADEKSEMDLGTTIEKAFVRAFPC
ncbi:hypothetical protein EV286_10216 [Rhizobium sp. BK251]|nr:hypothetical protein EV286_10216 [Rhizobium sp. BK251]